MLGLLRQRLDLCVVLLVFWFSPFPIAAEKTTAVRFGKLVDGTGKVSSDAVVVVQNGRIVRVGPGDAAMPPDAEVIDLTHYTGIPGLIDVHTHMTYYWDGAAGSRPWEQLHD